MWFTLTEHEQQDRLFQLKVKEEKLRKEGKLDTMAIHLPGARCAVAFNLFGLIGENAAELERRIKSEEEKAKDSGIVLILLKLSRELSAACEFQSI